MNISVTNNIQFGAIPRVKKSVFRSNGVPCPANFVEIDPKNPEDIYALKDAVETWQNDIFGVFSYHAARALMNKNKHYDGQKVFALTLQKDNFEHLEPEKILGVLHAKPISQVDYFVEHIQANPNYLYCENPEYLGIGKAMINSLKKICTIIRLFPLKSERIRNFYIKNGFYEYPEGTNCYVWIKNIFDR